MEEYRLAKGWRIVTYIISPLMIGLGIGLIVMSFSKPLWTIVLLTVVALGLLFLFVYAIIDAYKGKFVIAVDYVEIHSPFGIRRLDVNAIRGYRRDKNYIHIIPIEKRDKTIKVSLYYGGMLQILDWLSERYIDLDVADAQQEYDEILQNPALGITEEVIERRLEEAKKIARYANGASWVVLIWVFFYPKPYDIAVGVAMVFPLLVLLICYSYRGFMRGDDNEKGSYPSVITAFIMPSLVLGLRALLDFNILEYKEGWIFIGFMAVTLYIAYMLPTGGFTFRKTSDYFLAILFPIFTFFYSFGIYVTLNCRADRSEPAFYQTAVESKRTSSGKSTTYYLDLQPWEGRTGTEEVTVSHSEYDAVQKGDSVSILQYKGYLRMPWIEVLID
jgi:hypothetical protein